MSRSEGGLPRIGGPPDWLSADQKAAWNYLVERCPAGVLCRSDEVVVEIAARLLAAERAGTQSRAGTRQLLGLLGKFAMTPANRNRVLAGRRTTK